MRHAHEEYQDKCLIQTVKHQFSITAIIHICMKAEEYCGIFYYRICPFWRAGPNRRAPPITKITPKVFFQASCQKACDSDSRKVVLKIYHTYMLQNTCGNKQGQMVTPVLPSCQPLLSTKPPVVFIENEWDVTLGPVYLQLVDLNSFKRKTYWNFL